MSLFSVLPKPKNVAPAEPAPAIEDVDDDEDAALEAAFQGSALPLPPSSAVSAASLLSKASVQTGPPRYGFRKGWVPRSAADFGDGGAFPEIHIPQYPLGMGKKREQGNTIPLQVDAEGNVQYDAIVQQGRAAGTIVKSKFNDLVAKDISSDPDAYARPDDEAVKETTETTRAALEKIVAGKIKQSLPSQSAVQERSAPTLIRYTPQNQAEGTNSDAMSRIIRLVDAPSDPLEPPKFRHKRLPRGPPSPPVPVMHSPPRKVTVQEQRDWKIPPCISNWKNSKGHIIPLDKRIAADGRGMQESSINSNFAKFAEALSIADKQVREEVELRRAVQTRIAHQEKEQKEHQLRDLAQQALASSAALGRVSKRDESDEAVAEREREEIRRDQRYQVQKDLRTQRMGKDLREKMLERESDRDISEKIALGLAQPTMSKDMMFDQRLFNQSQGMGSGLHDDDGYTVYDKPLFNGSQNSSIYVPRASKEDAYGSDADVEKLRNSDRFQPDKGFKGTDQSSAQPRSGPVQFEKEEADPFGLDDFMTGAAKRKRPLDGIGEHGQMTSSAGNASTDSSGRSRIDFSSSSDASSSDSKRSRH